MSKIYLCNLFFLENIKYKLVFYGVGEAAVIAIDCATAIQVPAAIPAPCEAAKTLPATGPAAESPITPRIAGEPNKTPVTRTGVKIAAVAKPIVIFFSINLREVDSKK